LLLSPKRKQNKLLHYVSNTEITRILPGQLWDSVKKRKPRGLRFFHP